MISVILPRYCKAKENDSYVQAIYEEYKGTRNSITKIKRQSIILFNIMLSTTLAKLEYAKYTLTFFVSLYKEN